MATASCLTSCPSGIVPESKLSHKPQAHDGFILKLSHHVGKNHRASRLKTIYRLVGTNCA